jgi:hypothetical protein
VKANRQAAVKKWRARMMDEGRCVICAGPVDQERRMGTHCSRCVARRRAQQLARAGTPDKQVRHYSCGNCGGLGHSSRVCGFVRSAAAEGAGAR